MGLYADLAWTEDAACREYPVDLFFGKQSDPMHEARSICATCPVIADCLTYIDAIESGALGVALSYPSGLYAGLSPRQRAKRREQNGSAA